MCRLERWKSRPIHFFFTLVHCLWHSEHWTQFNIHHRSITVDEKHTIIPSKDCKRINFTLKRSTKIIEITNVYTYHSEPFFQIKLSTRRFNWYNIFICLRNSWPRHQNLITWRGEKQVFCFLFLQLFRWGQFVHENELNLNFQFWNNNKHDWVMQCRFDCILYHTKLS